MLPFGKYYGTRGANQTLESGFFLYAKIISKWRKILCFTPVEEAFLQIFIQEKNFKKSLSQETILVCFLICPK